MGYQGCNCEWFSHILSRKSVAFLVGFGPHHSCVLPQIVWLSEIFPGKTVSCQVWTVSIMINSRLQLSFSEDDVFLLASLNWDLQSALDEGEGWGIKVCKPEAMMVHFFLQWVIAPRKEIQESWSLVYKWGWDKVSTGRLMQCRQWCCSFRWFEHLVGMLLECLPLDVFQEQTTRRGP